MKEQFLTVLQEATAVIPAEYFQVPVADREEPIFRERVYCYELYHQMRLILDSLEEGHGLKRYTLSGEVDKQNHPIIRRCAPDLIVHEPGNMGHNLAVVEVKSANGDVAGIRKDLETLTYFVSDEVRYDLGVHLVYGGTEKQIDIFVTEFKEAAVENLTLYWHREPGEEAISLL